MTALLRQRRYWFAALLFWIVVLCTLSSLHGNSAQLPPVDHIDKVLHFGYFLGGGFFFAGWRHLRNDQRPGWKSLMIPAVITMALIGALDEWHQTFTPGRSGADIGDWIADIAGGTMGAALFKMLHLKWR